MRRSSHGLMTPSVSIGSVLRARYKITQLLHRSRLANVYMVEDQHIPGRVWAMKELPMVAVDSYERQRVLKRFAQDATLLASLSHPNVSKVVDYFADGNHLYIVREYVHGSDLRTFLAGRVVPMLDKEAIAITLQVIDALVYLQSKRFSAIFYREFHASNIVLIQDSSVKVIDLGLAQLFQAFSDQEAQSRIGSLEYSAPEQFADDGSFDDRSLVYSVGALLYHMVTRRNPASSPFALTPIEELNPQVSRGLIETIVKATQNDPRYRFQSLTELRRRLVALGMRGTRATQKLSAPNRTSRVWLSGVIFFFIMALVAGVFLLLPR
ncbi:MAG: serine/threonine-protein kinase [Candidatus Xenobia bacterium]